MDETDAGKDCNPEEVLIIEDRPKDTKEDAPLLPLLDVNTIEEAFKEAFANDSVDVNEAFVFDTDIGLDPGNIYALVVFLLAVDQRKIPHENVLLVSNADNTGEKLRARFIRQIASALSDDCYSCRDHFDDIRVVSGRPGSMILDETYFTDRPGIGVGQYKRRGQAVLKPVRSWIYAQEEEYGESVVDAAPDASAEFLRRMLVKDATTTWICMGAATNLDDCFTNWENNNGTLPPINDIVLTSVAFPEECTQVQTSNRLDPKAFIRVLKAVQTKHDVSTQTDAGVIPVHILSTLTTRDEKMCWLKQERSSFFENELENSASAERKLENNAEVVYECESGSKVENEFDKKSAAWLAPFPSVMEAVRANNSNPKDLNCISQTWCFDSNAHDSLTVIFALLLKVPKARDAMLPMHPVLLKVRDDAAHNNIGDLLEVRVGHRVFQHLNKIPLVTGVDDDVVSVSPLRMSLFPLSDAQMRLFTSHVERILEPFQESSWYIWLLFVQLAKLIDLDAGLSTDFQCYL